MTLGDAIDRICEDLGNRGGSTVLRARTKERIYAAQRDLESGKTLPKFLVQEDATLTLLSGASSLALPTGFIRVETAPHFVPSGASSPVFLQQKLNYQEAVEAARSSTSTDLLTTFVIRKSTIDFINTAAQNYTFLWNYYKHADIPAADSDTNAWLSDTGAGADWLIGEAGWRMALSIRDKEALTVFTQLRQSGRAAVFGEIVAEEDSAGPFIMGADL
jgi:hypothetical protein